MRKLLVGSITLLLITLVWGSVSVVFAAASTSKAPMMSLTVFKVIGGIVIYLFLPLNALTYHYFRRLQQ